MPARVKFPLDEHVASAIASGLRRRGFEVTTTAQTDLMGASDDRQLSFATAEGRVLVSHDPDFIELHGQGRHHAGIAYCQQGSRSVGDMLRTLILIGEVLTPEEMQDHLEYL